LEDQQLTDVIEKLTSHESFERASKAFRAYRAARDELKALGVIRSERSVAGDYGEWIAAQMLDLKLADSGVQAGYDAMDSRGKTYQVKTRIIADINAATSFDMRLEFHPFDYLVGVLVSPACELLAVFRLPASEVASRAVTNRGSRRLRWTSKCWDAEWVEVLYRVPTP
jgi:hypothetical protein